MGKGRFQKEGYYTYIKVSNAYCSKTKRYIRYRRSVQAQGLEGDNEKHIFYVTLKYPAIGWLEVLAKIFL